MLVSAKAPGWARGWAVGTRVSIMKLAKGFLMRSRSMRKPAFSSTSSLYSRFSSILSALGMVWEFSFSSKFFISTASVNPGTCGVMLFLNKDGLGPDQVVHEVGHLGVAL